MIAAAVAVLATACSDPVRVSTPLVESDQRASPLFVPATGTFKQIASGNAFTCALRADGAMQCWGPNVDGGAPPLQQAGVGVYTRITAGPALSCAVRSDGKLECFGFESLG